MEARAPASPLKGGERVLKGAPRKEPEGALKEARRPASSLKGGGRVLKGAP